MKNEIENLRAEIEALKARNQKVESAKAWEVSWTRRLALTVILYFITFAFMRLSHFARPGVEALVPPTAYLISASSLFFLKKWWLKRYSGSMSRNQKGFVTIGIVFAFTFGMPFASSLWIDGSTSSAIYAEATLAPATELAVVLGAAAYPSRLSDVLKDRMDTAIELYNTKKVATLFLTGASNEVAGMAAYAKEKGVPEADLILDPDGFNTLASIQHIPTSYKKVTLVTQKFHLPRAIFYARHEGFEAIGVGADLRDYLKIEAFKKREVIANTKAIFDVLFTDDLNEWARNF